MEISKSDIIEIISNSTLPAYRPFYTERDFAWICQKGLLKYLQTHSILNSMYSLTYEHPVTIQALNGPEKRYADLAIVSKVGIEPIFIIEFKYEPRHDRSDIGSKKLPVVTMNGITKDRDRIQEMKKSNPTLDWLFVLLDEGNHFKDKIETIYNLFEEVGLDKSNVLIINDQE